MGDELSTACLMRAMTGVRFAGKLYETSRTPAALPWYTEWGGWVAVWTWSAQCASTSRGAVGAVGGDSLQNSMDHLGIGEGHSPGLEAGVVGGWGVAWNRWRREGQVFAESQVFAVIQPGIRVTLARVKLEKYVYFPCFCRNGLIYDRGSKRGRGAASLAPWLRVRVRVTG